MPIEKVIAQSRQRTRVLGLLYEVQNGISSMLDRPHVDWKIDQSKRELTREEIKGLCDARIDILKAVGRMEQYVSQYDVEIDLVCSSDMMVRRFRNQSLYTVANLCEADPDLFRSVMSECEKDGVRDQLHMYLFMRAE